MLQINPGLILWTIITFVIVLMILRWTAWKPLLAALTAREEKIRASIEQAEQARQQAQALLEEHRRQVAAAEDQVQRILSEGRALADRHRAEIAEKAENSARHMIAQAKEEIQREKDAALMQLRSEVADLAIGAAGKILDKNLDTPAQRALADAAIREITRG
jgi:F-type H+-transporting ATPase subunit b